VRPGVAPIAGIAGQDGSHPAELAELMRIVLEADLELRERASGRPRGQGASG
jgi:hypothetical protein